MGLDAREQHWRDWLEAGLKGDEGAYRRFLAAIADALRVTARAGLTRAGRSPAESEDIVQEALIAIHTKRHTWDPAQPVGPWVRAIARHKLIDALRRRTGHDHLSVDDFAEVIPDAAAEPTLPRMDVVRMVDSLPDKQARLVRAVFLEGQRAVDVAPQFGMNEGAVRVALHRALKVLAARFGQGGGT